MKNLFLLLLITPALCFGKKDYCKKITKNVDKQGAVTYRSPELKYISVLKQFNANAFFVLHFHFRVETSQYDAVGALIQFEDGTTIKDENVKVDCRQEMSIMVAGNSSSASMAHSGEYLLQGFFHITEENIGKLTSQKIVKIQLHNTDQKINDKDAEKIMSYIKCLEELKQ